MFSFEECRESLDVVASVRERNRNEHREAGRRVRFKFINLPFGKRESRVTRRAGSFSYQPFLSLTRRPTRSRTDPNKATFACGSLAQRETTPVYRIALRPRFRQWKVKMNCFALNDF